MESNPENVTRMHYDLRLQIDPNSHWVSVTGNMVYHASEDQVEHVPFYLHRQFEIQGLGGPEVLGYVYKKEIEEKNPFFPEAGILEIYFNQPLAAGKTAFIQLHYEGQITDWPENSANLITPDWTELGAYLPWFPLLYQGAPADLTFTLQVTCPPEYAVASYGRSAQQNGTWYFNWPYPTTDIVVGIGRSLRTNVFESESNRVLLHSATFQEQAARQLGEDILWTLERFAGWFGPVRPGSEFTIIESPRREGGGYARRGMIVLGGLDEREYTDQREAYLRYLSHEAAHAWWWSAPSNSWEDWLNESFAEYSALMAVRERYGQDLFNRYIDRKREQSAGLPPLWEFNRKDTSTPEKRSMIESELYYKGPFLINGLAEKISNRRFLDLCRGMQWSGVQSTVHFLELLEELEGKPVREWMEAALKEN